MKNITTEANTRPREKEMPTIMEFGSAKLREGFDALGSRFNNGKTKAKLKLEILEADAELRKLATKIGRDVLKQIAEDGTPGVSEVFVEEAKELFAKKAALRRQLEGED